MFKPSLLLLTSATLFITACSSYPSDAKGVAVAACEAVKIFDFEAIKAYASADQHAQLDMAKKMLDEQDKQIQALPDAEREEAQAMMAAQKEKLKSIDCTTMQITDGEDGIKLGALAGIEANMRKMRLKQIDGAWKVIK